MCRGGLGKVRRGEASGRLHTEKRHEGEREARRAESILKINKKPERELDKGEKGASKKLTLKQR